MPYENIPFVPFLGDNFDLDFVNKKENINLNHYNEYLKKLNQSEIFKNFYFNYYTLYISPNKKNNYSTSNSRNKISTRAMSDESISEDNNSGIITIKNTTDYY